MVILHCLRTNYISYLVLIIFFFMKDYIIFGIRNFLGIDEDLTTILNNQEQIIEKLEGLEISAKEVVDKTVDIQKFSYFQYITFANVFYTLLGISFIASGIWLYQTDLFNTDILNSIKDLANLNKDLHQIDNKSILEALNKLQENISTLSIEELKLLLDIKKIVMNKGIAENISLDRPIDLIPKKGGFVVDDLT